MKTAPAFYDDNCNNFNINGMPNMRFKVNKVRYGKDGLDIENFTKQALEAYLLERN